MIVSVIVFEKKLIRLKGMSVENNVNDVRFAHKMPFSGQQTSNL
jgi:hypothetical protein